MNNLLAAFEKRDTFTLSEFGAAMSRMYSPDILKKCGLLFIFCQPVSETGVCHRRSDGKREFSR